MQHNKTNAVLAKSLILIKQEPIINSNNGRTTVRNAELLADITVNGTTPAETKAFQLNFADINPGNPIFVWLSEFAANFEFYKFRKLRFLYAPSSKTTRDGLVTMGFDYDPTDPAPADEQELFVVPGAQEGPVYEAIHTDADVKALHNLDVNGKGLYVTKDPNGVAAGDPRLVFGGTLWISTRGVDDGTETIIGRLIAEYEVELSVPNSRDRSVSNGVFAKQRTERSLLLPRVGEVSVNVNATRSIAASGRFPDEAAGDVLAKGEDLHNNLTTDWRNLMQYWDSVNQYWLFKEAGRYGISLDLIWEAIKTVAAGSESTGGIAARLFQGTPGGATTQVYEACSGPVHNLTTSSGPGNFKRDMLSVATSVDVQPGDFLYWELGPDIANVFNAPDLRISPFIDQSLWPKVGITKLGV